MIKINLQIFFIILFQFTIRLYGQDTTLIKNDTINKIEIIETMPEFPGGFQKIKEIIKDSLKYPEKALRERIVGKVITEFVVDTLGNAIDVTVVQSVSIELDNEAIRVTKLLNGWTPGTQGGRKVKVKYRLPFNFHLKDEKKRK